MPASSPQTERRIAAPAHHGHIIEYIKDRLYLGTYNHTPTEHTPFPFPAEQPQSPSKRTVKAQQGPTPSKPSKQVLPPAYFTVDKELQYNAFHADFGPLHMGHLYRFAVYLHDILGDPNNIDRPVVLWSKPDPRRRANAACILACYMVLIQSWPPHLALAPIAQMDPPCMPFRDAGYSQADYSISIQDVVYGVWKAKEEGIVGLHDFNLEEYETFERVDMGDFNWISPHFLAFASPQHKPVHVIGPSDPLYERLPRSIADIRRSQLPTPFKNVLHHFTTRNIGLVVRLNSELYSPSYFTSLGIQHLDMIFDDGTCPPLRLVRRFINLAHEMITIKKKGIAVHCKAGLGRTGCLIGAYLIYRHGFTANEVIAYMRFMRPGMVVGPQQHWLHMNQGTFREWWFEDTMREKIAAMMPSTPTKVGHKQRLTSNGQTFTPPNGSQKRSALGEIQHNEQHGTIGVHEENLPAPTPGQPRKTSRGVYGTKRADYVSSTRGSTENEPLVKTEAEVAVQTSKRTTTTQFECESEEEYQMRLLAKRHSSRSPGSGQKDKRRAVSMQQTTTTTTVTASGSWVIPDGDSDVENRIVEDMCSPVRASKITTPPEGKRSGSGVGSMSVTKVRASPTRRSTTERGTNAGVRKTSGRVGSVGTTAANVRSKQ